MGEVINLIDHRPHIAGDAKCLACGHEWVSVTPIGTTELECPECHTYRGVYFCNPGPEVRLECMCGSQHYYIDPYGPMCAKCGIRPDLDEQ